VLINGGGGGGGQQPLLQHHDLVSVFAPLLVGAFLSITIAITNKILHLRVDQWEVGVGEENNLCCSIMI
jgi:hypothetical protein